MRVVYESHWDATRGFQYHSNFSTIKVIPDFHQQLKLYILTLSAFPCSSPSLTLSILHHFPFFQNFEKVGVSPYSRKSISRSHFNVIIVMIFFFLWHFHFPFSWRTSYIYRIFFSARWTSLTVQLLCMLSAFKGIHVKCLCACSPYNHQKFLPKEWPVKLTL